MSQIFVSYSSQDAAVVRRLADILRQDGNSVFTDEDIPGGDLWRRRISEAIGKANVFVLMLSPKSIASDEVRRELDLAADKKKQILPVLIERVTVPSEMEYHLAGLQRIDISSNPVAGGERLKHAIRSLLIDLRVSISGVPDNPLLRAVFGDAKPDIASYVPRTFEPVTPPKPKPQGLAAILPGDWKVDVDSTVTSMYRTEDNYRFSLQESGEFEAERFASRAQTGHTSRYSDRYEGNWVLVGEKSVRFEYYPSGVGGKESFSFTFDLVKPRELRGTTDIHPLGRRPALWRRS